MNIILHTFLENFKLGSDIRFVFLKHGQHLKRDETRDIDTNEEAIAIIHARDDSSPPTAFHET